MRRYELVSGAFFSLLALVQLTRAVLGWPIQVAARLGFGRGGFGSWLVRGLGIPQLAGRHLMSGIRVALSVIGVAYAVLARVGLLVAGNLRPRVNLGPAYLAAGVLAWGGSPIGCINWCSPRRDCPPGVCWAR